MASRSAVPAARLLTRSEAFERAIEPVLAQRRELDGEVEVALRGGAKPC